MRNVPYILLLILLSPLLLLGLLCVLICLPFQIFFYKRSSWYADRNEKYHFGADQMLYYKIYNMAKKNEWSLDYLEKEDYHYFVCDHAVLFPLLDHAEDLFYDEEAGSWMVFEYMEDDQSPKDALPLEEYLVHVKDALKEALEDRQLIIVLDETALGDHISKAEDFFLVYADKKDLKQQLELLLTVQEQK